MGLWLCVTKPFQLHAWREAQSSPYSADWCLEEISCLPRHIDWLICHFSLGNKLACGGVSDIVNAFYFWNHAQVDLSVTLNSPHSYSPHLTLFLKNNIYIFIYIKLPNLSTQWWDLICRHPQSGSHDHWHFVIFSFQHGEGNVPLAFP